MESDLVIQPIRKDNEIMEWNGMTYILYKVHSKLENYYLIYMLADLLSATCPRFLKNEQVQRNQKQFSKEDLR